MLQGLILAAPPGCDGRQEQIFAQQMLAEMREERGEGAGFQQSAAKCIRDRYISVMDGFNEARDAER